MEGWVTIQAVADGSSSIISTPTTTTLAAVDTSGLVKGVLAFVQSPKTYWNLDPTSTAAPDNETVVAASAGGNWLLSDGIGLGASVGVKAFGAKGDGVSDDSTFFQTAVNALAGSGVDLHIPAGTYLITVPIVLPSDITIVGSAQATIKCNIGNSLGSVDSPFVSYVISDSSVAATTVAAPNTTNTYTVSATASVPVGTWVEIGNTLPAPQLLFRSGIYQVKSVAGVGPFTLTLDRPVVWTLGIGDTIQPVISAWNATYAPTVHDIPHDIQILGGGMRIVGVAVRYVEIASTMRGRVQDLVLDSTTAAGACSVALMSLDVASVNCVAERITAYVKPGLGLFATMAMESTENCKYVDCVINGATDSPGYLGVDAQSSEWVRCAAYGCSDGTFLSSGVPNNALGCQNCTIDSGAYNANLNNGIHVGSGPTLGSQDLKVVNTTCDRNGSGGVLLDTISKRVRLIGCDLTNNTTAGIVLNSSSPGVGPTGSSAVGCDFSGSTYGIDGGDVDFVICDAYSTNNTNAFFLWIGSDSKSGQLTIDGFEIQAPASPVVAGLGRIEGGTVVLANGRAIGQGGSGIMIDQAQVNVSVLKTSNIRVESSGTMTGLFTRAGNTARLGSNTDLSGCSTPINFPGGAFISRKRTVIANGTTGVAIAWPDANGEDVLTFTLQTIGGTVGHPKYTTTPGTGFTFTSDAADTSTYEYTVT